VADKRNPPVPLRRRVLFSPKTESRFLIIQDINFLPTQNAGLQTERKNLKTNVVIPTLTRHTLYMEVRMKEQLCKCGIDYQTWVAYDMQCVDDELHLWEQ
jgi:hypothetical protein